MMPRKNNGNGTGSPDPPGDTDWRAYHTPGGVLKWYGIGQPEGDIPPSWIEKMLPGEPPRNSIWNRVTLEFEEFIPDPGIDIVSILISSPILAPLNLQRRQQYLELLQNTIPETCRYFHEE